MRLRVKVCGLTRPGDARLAAELGADALGLVFHPASPRYVDVHRARAVLAGIPPWLQMIGLFLDASEAYVRDVLAELPLDALQFHGSEPQDFCVRFGRPYYRALAMAGRDLEAVAAEGGEHAGARGLLLDGHGVGEQGGSGRRFDWQRLPPGLDRSRLILAGGLAPGNLFEAVATSGVHAVDISSGVESSPGIKDPDKLSAFFAEVQRVNQQL